ncbi:MAG: hypothetical protein IBX36_05670 [Dehalococcoidia bacterium]|nr:hypothetical protein [Dehalococcoidia bacterium]
MELLIDGVLYKLWTPKDEAALENMVKEHAKDIFGEDSIYFDIKPTLRSQAGIGSKPDGYVIALGDTPRWYIVEVELSSHPLYEHIATQMIKFSGAIGNPRTQKAIVDATYREIREDVFKQTLVQKEIGAREIHEFLSGLISSPPILVIVIEEKTKELEEVCARLPLKTEVVEFKTFEREGVGLAVHAHLFEPMWKLMVKEPVVVARQEEGLPRREEDHLDGVDSQVKEIYQAIKSSLLEFKPSLRFNPRKYYISIVDKKNFAYIYIRRRKLMITIMLPENIVRSAVRQHKVVSETEGTQRFYGGECATVFIEDKSNLDEVINVLKIPLT